MFIFTMRIFCSVRNLPKLSSFFQRWERLRLFPCSVGSAWRFEGIIINGLGICTRELLLNVDGKKNSLGKNYWPSWKMSFSPINCSFQTDATYCSIDGEIKREEGLNSHLIYGLILLSKSSQCCTIFIVEFPVSSFLPNWFLG